MNLSKQIKFTLAIALQVVVILSIVIFKMAVVTSGTEVLLKIQPVDPRDYLRGDYITFQYEISMPQAYDSFNVGETVYVPLYKSGSYWYADIVSKQKPANGKVFIKGRVTRTAASNDFGFQTPSLTRGSIGVEYGIEQYFIPEGSGQNLRLNNAAALVAVDDDGNAVIKKIYIDGKPWP